MTAATTQQTFFHMLEQVRHLLEHQPPAEQIAALARLEQMLSQATTSIDTYRASRAARRHPTLFGTLTQHQRTDLADLEDRAMEEITSLLSSFSEHQGTIATQLSRATPDKKLLSATALQYERAIRSLHTAATTLIGVHRKIDRGMKLEGDHLVKEARLIVLALVSVLGLTIVFTCRSMRWSIAQPLHRLMATADRVAHHDLTAKVESWPNRDEVGTLATSLSSMVTSLRERTAALTHKTKELEAFTYTIAHDLKGPLREIEGFSSLLEKQYVDQGDPHVMHYIDVIRKSSLRLTHMIDALLKYSRLEQQDFPRARFNLLEMISSLLVDRQSQFAGITPQITVNLPFADLYGESVSIRQALVYLLDNALKFSRYSLAQNINIGGQQTSTEPILWIQDNDIGFDVGQTGKIPDLPDQFVCRNLGIEAVNGDHDSIVRGRVHFMA